MIWEVGVSTGTCILIQWNIAKPAKNISSMADIKVPQDMLENENNMPGSVSRMHYRYFTHTHRLARAQKSSAKIHRNWF